MDSPLFDFADLPRFSDITPDLIEPAVAQCLEENRIAITDLLQQVTVPDWDNFVQPLEDLDERLHRMWSPVSHLHAVRDEPALREVYEKCLPLFTAYASELNHNEALYEGYRQVAARPDFAKWSAARQKVVNNALRDFRLGGAGLDPQEKAQLKEIDRQLSLLGNRFARNVLDATQGWYLHITGESDLAGLPPSARTLARQAAAERQLDGWIITLDGPAYLGFITNSCRRELREQVYRAFVSRASDRGPGAAVGDGQWDNTQVMQDILRLRQQRAHLLGFENYAALSLETKMARSVDEVLAFLYELADRSRAAAREELATLQQFARERDGLEGLHPWDIPYYSELLRQQEYAVSQEALRPWFPLPRVLSGLFDIVQRLYGIRVEERKSFDRYHKDVRFYDIYNSDGQLRGGFYLDPYARTGKRGGAWMDECRSRKQQGDRVQTPVAYLVCNFAPPVDGQSALLTHSEVTTLFHEFGHGLHHMLTRVDYVSVSGINGVEWDAVELPSQFLENWCWAPDAVALISGHVDTGEPLPGEQVERLGRARRFQAGMQMVRQLEFAIFDMRLHGEYREGVTDIQALLDDVRKQVAVVFPPADNRFQHSFSHIFAGGYAAGYYSYKWAEVLAADAFSVFEEKGVFDRDSGERFMRCVLEQGGSRDALSLFMLFRGREPRIDALLHQAGLAA